MVYSSILRTWVTVENTSVTEHTLQQLQCNSQQ